MLVVPQSRFCVMWVTSIPRLISPPPTLKIKKKKKCLPWITRVAPNQLHLRSKFIISPWQHQGNKQECLDGSWYPPPPMPKPTHHPWLFPEGGVSSSQVQGKQGRGWGGGLWPSWGRISTSTLHWSKMRILHARALVKGGRVGRWTRRFCNLDVSRPNCLLSQPKMDPSGATDYIREDSLFSQGRPDKRDASVPLAIWSQNNRKGPRKKKKKAQPAHSLKWKESSLNRWDGLTDKQTYSKASHIYAEIGTQSTSANKAVYMGSDEQACKSLADLSKNGILLCTKQRTVPHIHHYYCKLSMPRGSSISSS